jgi:ribonuclease P protein component
MLPKNNRLTKKKDFEYVFKKGRSFKEDFLILKIIENQLGQIRFGFVVSQKISKKASLRNKIKRRISESVRLKIGKLKKRLDGILIALPEIEKKDFWKIDETIEKLFKKAKIL